jgi:hypothetical protein
MTSNGLITQKAYAESKGWNPSYICKLVKQGKIRLVDKKIDPEVADAALKAMKPNQPRVDKPPARVDRGDLGSISNSYMQARTVHETYRAKKERLEFERMSGKLIYIRDVQRFQEQVNSNIRSRLLQLPSKLAQRIVGTDDQAKIKAIVEAEIHETLTELSQNAGNVELNG